MGADRLCSPRSPGPSGARCAGRVGKHAFIYVKVKPPNLPNIESTYKSMKKNNRKRKIALVFKI